MQAAFPTEIKQNLSTPKLRLDSAIKKEHNPSSKSQNAGSIPYTKIKQTFGVTLKLRLDSYIPQTKGKKIAHDKKLRKSQQHVYNYSKPKVGMKTQRILPGCVGYCREVTESSESAQAESGVMCSQTAVSEVDA
jgi:hypothetical protein